MSTKITAEVRAGVDRQIRERYYLRERGEPYQHLTHRFIARAMNVTESYVAQREKAVMARVDKWRESGA